MSPAPECICRTTRRRSSFATTTQIALRNELPRTVAWMWTVRPRPRRLQAQSRPSAVAKTSAPRSRSGPR